MNEPVTLMVRVYLHEMQSHIDDLLAYLHDQAKVRGVTVFRGIAGFGTSGKLHSSRILDMSLDLPVVVEFYDEESRVMEIIRYLNSIVAPGHIVYWPVKTALQGKELHA